MKSNFLVLFCLLSKIIFSQEFTNLEGDYLGQTPPGDMPVVFARGIVSDSFQQHGVPSFSPDGNEVFWQTNRQDNDKNWLIFTKTARRIDGKWTTPEDSPYGSGAVFSHDGKRLYFGSKEEGADPYFIEKNGTDWSQPKSISLISRFPELKFAYNLSIASNGTLYFLGYAPADSGLWNNYAIYRAELKNGQYVKPELLPSCINASGNILNWTPYIAPDESYLIFCSRRLKPKDDYGDLFICFRKPNGSWTDRISLGELINTTGLERFPSVSPDGKYLFFTRWTPDNDEDVFWVSAKIIDDIKKTVFNSKLSPKEIHDAAAAGDLNKVKTLLEADSTLLESKDGDGNTPLNVACGTFQVATAHFLIDMGANVNAKNNYGLTTLHRAIGGKERDIDLIQKLISKGADVNAKLDRGLTALHFAAMYDNLNEVQLLIDQGADLNACDNVCYGTVLHTAINIGPNEEIAKLLVESGAKINQKFSFENTELHLATMKGYSDLVLLLIKHGADIQAMNGYNHTALYYAAKHGYRKTADVLIAAGAKKSVITETNYGKAAQLTAKLKDGEAYLWYMGGFFGGGYAVKTKNNLLIFDKTGINESPEASLANGNLNPKELEGQKITVLITKAAVLNNEKQVLDLAKNMNDVHWVFDAKPVVKDTVNTTNQFHLAVPNEIFNINGITVHTVPAAGRGNGGATGVGYIVEPDGIKIFHSGFHVSGYEPTQIESYHRKIDSLKSFGPIDIAILTVSGHLTVNYEPYLFLIDQLSPKVVFLMGGDAATEEYPKCVSALHVRNIPVKYPESGRALGERFHYPLNKK